MSAKADSVAAAATPKKSVKSAGKAKRKTAVDHPKVSEMVNEAISNLKERNGSSLRAIKKYISSNFPVEVEKVAPFIRRYLKSQVGNGSLIQTKGKGASGSFKLGSSGAAPAGPRKRPSAASRAAAVAAAPPRAPKVKAAKAPKKVAKEKTKRSPKKAKTPKPKKAVHKSKKPASTPKQEA